MATIESHYKIHDVNCIALELALISGDNHNEDMFFFFVIKLNTLDGSIYRKVIGIPIQYALDIYIPK